MTMVIKDKPFKVYLSVDQINKAVNEMAERMNLELKDKSPLFVIVLNGAFMFASDLLKKITIDCGLSFVKVSSYDGLSSSSNVRQLIGLDEDISGRTVVIVEDIVDTGITMENIINYLQPKKPAAIKIATLLFKPEAFKKDMKLDYVGIVVPNSFLVGYGLDYDGEGRNLQDIYILDKQ
jgi:hypoxanthine phosphoribosyltransferase